MLLRWLSVRRTRCPGSARGHSGEVSAAGSRRQCHLELPGNSRCTECSLEGVILNSGWVFPSPFLGGTLKTLMLERHPRMSVDLLWGPSSRVVRRDVQAGRGTLL